ncbi:unnamed protein product [Symbiodinium natans]|uniref:Uncharacterized protein n=1 Tax=Symbiodinium natans TaxID=878477 RepID=A0A812SKR4_9DINO|nr:unnamed protein product [Symbiodinium natans]
MQRLRFRATVARRGRTRGRKAWQKDTLLLRNVVATSADLPGKIHTDHVWLKAAMLAADKLLLTSTIRKNATELKGKELALHKGNFDAVGTQAAVLAGFAVVMVVEFHMPETAHFALQGVYYVFAVITLVANLRCVAMTTCITVMGTGLALRGPDGSMVRAVEGMYNQRAIVFRSFGTGIVACCCSVAVIAWIKMDPIPACICTGAIAWTLFSIARYTRFYLEFFKFNEDEVVSLDDILGADLVNKENIVKQLGIGSDTLVRLLGAITQNRRQHTPDTATEAPCKVGKQLAQLAPKLGQLVEFDARVRWYRKLGGWDLRLSHHTSLDPDFDTRYMTPDKGQVQEMQQILSRHKELRRLSRQAPPVAMTTVESSMSSKEISESPGRQLTGC